ncbi:MAG: hypothetical protein Q4G59_00975 [Planctomycetia bacterium]|nr:hypothetical protein [Planctomycetia bacterium]
MFGQSNGTNLNVQDSGTPCDLNQLLDKVVFITNDIFMVNRCAIGLIIIARQKGM